MLSYPQRGQPLPRPKARGAGLVPIAVEAEIAAKLAALEALRSDQKEVRRILDPLHPTKLSTLSEALRALDRRLVVAMEALP